MDPDQQLNMLLVEQHRPKGFPDIAQSRPLSRSYKSGMRFELTNPIGASAFPLPSTSGPKIVDIDAGSVRDCSVLAACRHPLAFPG